MENSEANEEGEDEEAELPESMRRTLPRNEVAAVEASEGSGNVF